MPLLRPRSWLTPLFVGALLSMGSSLTHALDGEWVQVPADTLTGPRRQDHSAVYDRAGDRLLTFGGITTLPVSVTNQVWEMKLANPGIWRVLAPLGTPPTPRHSAATAWDPVRNRMIVYGGSVAAEATGEVWALDLSGTPTWVQLAPSGAAPQARSEHTMVYDAAGDRMIVHGGYRTSPNAILGDVWALSLAGTPQWSAILPSGTPPVARGQHVAIYDPVRNRMVIHGGFSGAFDALSDMWALSLSGAPAWTVLPQSGLFIPNGLRAHGAVYDSTHDEMVMFGGNENHPPSHNKVWTCSMATGAWTEHSLFPLPLPRHSFGIAIDTHRNQMIVQGGATSDEVSKECWLLPLDTKAWSKLPESAGQPAARWYHAAAYDPVRDRMIVHGGYSMDGSLYSISLNGDPEWDPLPATGISAAAQQHQMVCDPVRDRMILIGGTASLTSIPVVDLNPALAWSTIAPTGTPPPADLIRPTAIYDPVRDRILMFGGYTSSPAGTRDELWELSLSGSPAWTLLSPVGTPPPSRAHHTAIYDPAGDRMIVYGGYSSGPSGPTLADVWQLALSGTPTWSPLAPGGNPGPGPRLGHTAVLDAERSRMLVYIPDAAQDTVWALGLTAPEAWTALLPPAGPGTNRSFHVAAFDPNSDRMIVTGGVGDAGVAGDIWELRFENVVGVPGTSRPIARALHGAIPNPSRGTVNAWFSLPDERPARLELFDLHGRRVAARDIAGGVGRRSIAINEMSRMPAGLYLMKLEHAGVAHTSRFVHVR